MQHATALQPFSAASARPLRRTAAGRTSAGANGAGPVAALSEGSRVRVTAPIKVFHAPKYKAGLDLQGKEGVVVQPNVCDYKHHDGQKHQLSANLPVKVQFLVPPPSGEGKEIKVLAHLAENEVEAL